MDTRSTTTGSQAWDKADSVLMMAWLAAGLLVRLPLLWRVEGVLDHDQSVVGLMALDIAEGRRFPIYFDGQGYMGALEAYVAACFVRAFGHDPMIVACAPWLAFGVFVAAQFAVWRVWRDRSAGHLAAMITVIGSPMLALWGIIPRGGYVEFLAWALPTLAAYQAVTRPGRPPLSRLQQLGWGFLLAFGYFLNPFCWTIYATLAIDWTFFRHGSELRASRLPRAGWLDAKRAPLVWTLLALGYVNLLAAIWHVDPFHAVDHAYVLWLGWGKSPISAALAVVGVLATLFVAAWWSLAPQRLGAGLARHPYVAAGCVLGCAPVVIHAALSRLGVIPPSGILPMWIGAPWNAGVNFQRMTGALGFLIGCDPDAARMLFFAQGVDPPAHAWPLFSTALERISPLACLIALALIAAAAWRGRLAWPPLLALRGDGATPPTVLSCLYLMVMTSMFLLQPTSVDGSAVRYLLPLWIVLPGLFATGLLTLPRRWSIPAGAVLAGCWLMAQASLWADLDQVSDARALARELQGRGIDCVVAATPAAIIVANMSHGAVGACEFRPIWPRLGERYRDRFRAGAPVTCVIDRRFPCGNPRESMWTDLHDLRRHLKELAARGARVNQEFRVGEFEVWKVDLPLADVLDERERPPAPGTSSLALRPAN